MNIVPLSRGHWPGISDRSLDAAERALKKEAFLLKGANLPDISHTDLFFTSVHNDCLWEAAASLTALLR